MAEMAEKGVERMGLAAGLIAWAGVALPLVSSDFRALVSPQWVVSYLAYGVLFTLTSEATSKRVGLWLLAPQVLCGLAVLGFAPGYGYSAVLVVVTAVTAAFLLPLAATLALIAGQTAFLALTGQGESGVIDLTAAFVHGGFQLFALVMVESLARESRAREELAAANLELAATNAELAATNAELAAAQARLAETSRTGERLRISRDLHDLVGHQLTALAVNLEVASHLAHGPAAAQVELSRKVAKDLLRDVRAVVSTLRESPLDLPAALRTISAAVPQPQIHLSIPEGLIVPDLDQTEALMRCVQEIITNSIRHAGSDNLWIDVSRTSDGETVVRARDDGKGTDRVRPGNGLLGMGERLEELGGQLSYESSCGAGFSVVARLPVAA